MENIKLKGQVSWFDEKKGFGIINYQNNDTELGITQYFAHHSEICVNSNIFKALYKDEYVEFYHHFDENKNKLIATKITGCEDNKLTCETNNKTFKNNTFSNKKKGKPKNTESFKPDHSKSNMCVKFGNSEASSLDQTFSTNDVILVNNFIPQSNKNELFEQLLNEINVCVEKNPELWKLWHGDTHLIADDKIHWKEDVPTFQNIIVAIEKYFNFNTMSTRFNLYQNSDDWKPFHHDAAAIKPHIAEKQNTTIAISFGATRETAFQFNDNKCVVSFPLEDNSVYLFGKDVNIQWKHGIPQIPKDKFSEEKRISIILWGWMDQEE